VAAELAKNVLITSPASSVAIYTTDHQIIPWIMNTDRHDNILVCRMICNTLATTLFNHPDTTISISWIPDSASFLLLKCILGITTETVANISKPDMHCGVCGSAVQIIIDHHSVIVTIVKVLISRALHR
jgi:hypothetical protein